MNILWVKDGKLGHEKQVGALLEEISSTQHIDITEIRASTVLNQILELITFGLLSKDIDGIENIDFDLIIGAGSDTHLKILNLKRRFKKAKTISILCPNIIMRKSFDYICIPTHDSHKRINKHKSIFFEGSLSKIYDGPTEESIGMFSIGGMNKYYEFDEDYILEQVCFLASIHPYKMWHIFNSRRTPSSMNNKIKNLLSSFKNIIFEDVHSNDIKNQYQDILHNASIRVITKDSVNMVYESLSSSGQSFVFDMEAKNSNKIVKNINALINERRIGCLDKTLMADGLFNLKLRPQNKHLDVMREVEKLAYTILNKLNIR